MAILFLSYQERLEGVYQELGGDAATPILFTTLIEHPVVQDIIVACNIYKAVVRKLPAHLYYVYRYAHYLLQSNSKNFTQLT